MRVKGTGSLQQVMSAVPDTWELILTLPKEPNTPKRSPKQEVCRVFEGDKQQANLALDKYKAEYTKRLESDSGNAIEARLQKARKPVKNSWQLVLSLIDGKRTIRHFRGNKADARKALEAFRREIESGLKLDASKVTFGEYAQSWYDGRMASGKLSAATMKRDYYLLRHLRRHINQVALSDIDTTVVRGLYTKLVEECIGSQTAAKLAVMLKQILKQAVCDDIILRNPCDRVEAPKAPRISTRDSLDRQGVTRLVRALKDAETDYIAYPNITPATEQRRLVNNLAHVTVARLALATGLRRGEILGLSWEHISFDDHMLKVRQSLDKLTGQLKSPKTASSIRDVVLDNLTLKDLKRWKVMQAEYLLGFGIAQKPATPVITDEIGGRMDGNNFARWWRAFREKYGFKGLKLHELRHTHATTLVSSGLNIKAVSSRLGHSSVAITLDLYAHAQREDDVRAAEIIGNAMSELTATFGQVVSL